MSVWYKYCLLYLSLSLEKSDKKNGEYMCKWLSAFFALRTSATAGPFSHFRLVDSFLLSLEPSISCKRFEHEHESGIDNMPKLKSFI